MLKTAFSYIKFYFNKFFSSKYKIEGKCNMCGACCKNIVFMIEDEYVKTEEQFESLKKFDKKYNHFVINEENSKNNNGVLLFRCKSLDENNRCKDYRFRSLYCRAYPMVTNKIRLGGCATFDSCGYKITKEKSFDEFLK